MRTLALPIAFALAITATLVAPTTLLAQEPPAVTTVEQAPGFHVAAIAQWVTYEAGLATKCPSVQADWAKATHHLYGTPTTAPNGNLVNATWVETVPGTACGQQRRYRVLVTVRSGRAGMQALLPGNSYASPTLERDARFPMIGAAEAFVPAGQKCAVDVIDTHLIAAPTAPKQPWNEVWTVTTCGKRLSVPIRFVPDATGDGTSIQIESKTVKPLP